MRSRWTPWLPILLAVFLLVGTDLVGPGGPTDPVRAASELAAPVRAAAATPVSGAPRSTGSVEVAPGYAPPSGVVSLGPTAASTEWDVAVGLPSQDPTGLAAFVAAASVPGAPGYRDFLTAAQADARFGAAPQAVAAARDYFAGFGLETTVDPDGLLVLVSGTSAGFSAAFDTTFDEYRTSAGTTFVDHPTPAVLPASLGTDGVFGLGNVTPLVPDVSAASSAGGPAPDAACTGPAGGLSPCAIADAYDIAPLEANGTTGAGIRIGVVDAYAAAEGQSQLASDLATFAADTSLSVGNVSYLYPVPTDTDLNASGTNSAWALEDALDLEWARASAPGATIDMTFSPNSGAGLYAAIDWLVANGAVDVVSMSWGEPDTGIYNAFSGPCTSACNASTDGSYEILGPVLELGAAEGITFFAASGDCGAADGTSGDATNFPASDPYVTGVGGTVLSLGTNDSYAGESAWSGNETGAVSPGCTNGGGSGGGFSPFPEPWWQAGIDDPNGLRGVPDVAMDAGTPVAVVVDGASEGVLGTSVGTPIWAGIAALADQYAGEDLGLLTPSLYDVLRGSAYADEFHDIVDGSNGYSAGPGWDPVTGIGSPIVGALVPSLARGGALAGGGLATSVFASPRSGRAGLTVSFAMNATGGTGSYPLEGISFGDGNSVLWNGTVVRHTYAIDGDYLAQSFVADGSGNTSTSLPVLIAVGGSDLSVDLTAAPSAPALGAPVTLSASASGGTAPYNFTFYFGDGSYSAPGPAAVVHDYGVAGAFCAEVIATDAAAPMGAGASARVPIAVGGATPANCTAEPTPLTVTPNASARVLDAPADYGTSLFTVTGGATGPGGLAPSTSLASNDSYLAACGCEIFRHPGNYSVTEWANDSVDGSAEASANVTVAPALDVTFAASALSGFAPLKVYYFSSATGGVGANANLTRWTFGDGASAVGHSVSTIYEVPGEYVAIGQLSDLGRGNGSEAFLVDVEPAAAGVPLGVTATISPAVNVSSGADVRFTATAVGTPAETDFTQILWNLGDGHSAFGTSVTETYYAPADAAQNDSLAGAVTVETSYLDPVYSTGFDLAPFFAIEPGGRTPRTDALVGAASVSPSENLVPFPIFGNASGSGPGGVLVSWNFGDGSTASALSVEHSLYASQGYAVAATITDGYGDRAVLLTAVTANGPLGIAGGPSPPTGPKPLTVTIATAAYGGKGPPYRYEWTLLNGSQPTTSTVSLYLPQVGTYVVHLNVTDRSGARIERNFTIVVTYPDPWAAAAILGGSAGIGALLAVVVRSRRAPRRPKPGEDPWLDHPRTASDGTPVW